MAQRRLLERLTVASLLVYASRPSSEADREAVGIVHGGIKQANARHLARVAQRMRELGADHPVRRIVPKGAVLIPAPGHAPLPRNALWTSREIAAALVEAGVGARVLPILFRTERVRRSTGARSGADREPPSRHFETIEVANTLEGVDEARPLVVVDDTVTTGSTLIACASLLAAVAPRAPIAAFAVVRADRHRTLESTGDMLDPLVETITLRADDARPWRG